MMKIYVFAILFISSIFQPFILISKEDPICFKSLLVLSIEDNLKFELTSLKDENLRSIYTSAIQKADLENFRLLDKEVELKFEEGFSCILKSAKKCKELGLIQSIENYPSYFPSEFKLPMFAFNQDLTLKATYPSYFDTFKK